MPWSLLEVDDLIRCDHWHLRRDDRCFFLREYIPRAGFAGGDTNSLILNLKKSPDRRGRPEWRHKSEAIARAVRELSVSLRAQPIAGALIVPIPPSKAPTDPLYDDRMVQVAQQLAGPSGAIACELLVREVSAPPCIKATDAAISTNFAPRSESGRLRTSRVPRGSSSSTTCRPSPRRTLGLAGRSSFQRAKCYSSDRGSVRIYSTSHWLPSLVSYEMRKLFGMTRNTTEPGTQSGGAQRFGIGCTL